MNAKRPISPLWAVLALAVIVGGCSAGPSVTPTPTPAATSAPATATADPTANPSSPAAPPALTETFTSAVHGISVSYPAGWVVRGATEPWPLNSIVMQESAFGDIIEDGSSGDTAFIALASQPVAGDTFDRWAADYLALEGCGPSEPITVDGALGIIGSSCPMALVSVADRGYLIWLYRIDDIGWFREILETAELHPEDAVEAAPSAAP